MAETDFARHVITCSDCDEILQLKPSQSTSATYVPKLRLFSYIKPSKDVLLQRKITEVKMTTWRTTFWASEKVDWERGSNVDLASHCNLIERAILDGRPQWMDEPVISRWATPNSKILRTLEEVDTLLHQWIKFVTGPFYPFSDALWLQTAELLRDAGLPRHNNNPNLPDEIDPSWPFHFKEFEREAVLAKGLRVGDENPSGYVCPWSEANLYSIRALQQELRRQRPTQKPLLVAARMDSDLVQSAAQLYRLEYFQVGDDWKAANIALVECTGACCSIIFAATLANDHGRTDDFTANRPTFRAPSSTSAYRRVTYL